MAKLSKNMVAEKVASPLLTRDNVAALLLSYYGAVSLDQVRVDQLRREGDLPDRYHDAQWNEHRENRERHLEHIELLLETLSLVSTEILAKLSSLAVTQKPAVVREVLLDMLEEGVCAHLVGERMWSAPEFFNALVKKVGESTLTPKGDGNAVQKMMRWLDPVDPLRIAQESGYKESMSPRVWS